MNPIELYLDFTVKDMAVISCTQYDVDARTIHIHILDNGKIFQLDKTKHSLFFKMTKIDSKKIFNECTINDDGTASYILTEQCCLFSGIFNIQFMLVNPIDKTILHTMPARLNITKSVADNIQIESSDEFNALNKLLLEIDGIKEYFLEIQSAIKKNEDIRKANEYVRENNENIRKSNETIRENNETQREANELIRQKQENQRQTDTATALVNAKNATDNANQAAKNANDKAIDLQNKLDSHYFVLTSDKDVANGVPSLDSNKKIPKDELYEANLSEKGVVQLTDSISSSSTTTAATPKSVKTTYDKVTTEETRAKNAENAIQSIIDSNKEIWSDKYTKNEIDNKFSALESNIDWKESVLTFSDIPTTYPNPQDGWTVNVQDTDYTYRYNGDKWVAISANAIPKATQSIDGLLSAADKVNYDDANSKKHTHSNNSVLDGITSVLITTWNTVTNKLDKTGDASNVTNSITAVSSRTNLSTGETLSTSLGKIAKWLSDLKSVAFSGNYNDLSNIPTSLPANGGNSATVNGHTVNSDVPSNAKFTDTTYSNATTSTAGLMSPEDKASLVFLQNNEVTGVKGDAEGSYRKGNVNITPANIGALSLSGGSLTGNITFSNQTGMIQIQNDGSNFTQAIRWHKGGTSQATYNPLIGQHNIGGDGTGSICILPYPTETSPWQGTVGLFIKKGSALIDGQEIITASNIANQSVKYATSAGSASAATTAVKLDSSAGSATQPVYFSSGKPVATTYTLGKSVPSNAVFTDTTYSNFVKSGSGAKAGLVPAPSTTAGTTKYLREDGTWQVPPNTDTTYGVATTSVAGLMSASDKTKLDGIITGANKTTVDSALSSTSTNPVQNKIVYNALSNKANSDHTHSYLPLSGGTVNGQIVFGESDAYGIRTNTNNYGRIGESGKQFYQVYANTFYENGTSLDNKYFLNSAFDWKLLGEVTGTTLIKLPSDWNEIFINVWMAFNETQSNIYNSIGIIPKLSAPEAQQIYYLSGGYAETDSRNVRILFSSTKLQLYSLIQDTTDYTSYTTMRVFYR